MAEELSLEEAVKPGLESPLDKGETKEGIEEPGAGLHSALRKERQRAKDLEKRLKQYEGIDPEEYVSLKTKAKELEEQELLTQQKYKEAHEKANEEKKLVEQKAIQLEKQLHDFKKQGALAKLYYQFGGKESQSTLTNQSNFDILYSAIAYRIQLDEESGQIIVLSSDGVTEGYNKDNTPMSLNDLMQEILADPAYGTFFAPQNEMSGGGIKGTNGRNGGRRASFEDFARDRGFKLK